jgi:hypothetical protein
MVKRIHKTVDVTINRFPVLINYATTGHKLQGQTNTSLFISEWHYGANWPYVVLSRVKMLKGLFLQIPKWIKHSFIWDNRLVQMLIRVQQKHHKNMFQMNYNNLVNPVYSFSGATGLVNPLITLAHHVWTNHETHTGAYFTYGQRHVTALVCRCVVTSMQSIRQVIV